MSEPDVAGPDDPGRQGSGPESGAQRRTAPGPPEPAANQAKTEPTGDGNVSPGTGSVDAGVGAEAGAGSAGTGQPDAGRAPRAGVAGGAAASAPGGPASGPAGVAGSGDDAGVTGLAETPMPGTSEASPAAQGVRGAVDEGGGPAASDPSATGIEQPVNMRRTDGSGPGSAAAARGEALQPHVEQTQTGSATPPPTHDRPVTGVRRPAAPSGEVGST
jgi:hypothetical protein